MPLDSEMESPRPAFDLEGRAGRYSVPSQVPRRGGQAEVFYAQAPDGSWRAVKIAAGGWAARKAIDREALLLREIGHREPRAKEWLIEIIDEGRDRHDNPFLVLPWYDLSLSDWLSQYGSSAPFSDRLRLSAWAARAVARMHLAREEVTRVLVHRDLKPGNFLLALDARGRPCSVVLADLGAAKEGDVAIMASQTRIMTVDYAPPEQMFPIPRASDLRVDVHALGVTVYRVLTGRIPQAIKRRARFITDAGEALLHDAEEARVAGWEDFVRRHADIPVSELVVLSQMVPLTGEDEALLREVALAPLLRMHVDDAAVRALADRLVAAVRKAVHPDPELRAHDAAILTAVLEQAWRAVVAAEADSTAPTASTAAPRSDPKVEDPSSSKTEHVAARRSSYAERPTTGDQPTTVSAPTLSLSAAIRGPTVAEADPPAPTPGRSWAPAVITLAAACGVLGWAVWTSGSHGTRTVTRPTDRPLPVDAAPALPEGPPGGPDPSFKEDRPPAPSPIEPSEGLARPKPPSPPGGSEAEIRSPVGTEPSPRRTEPPAPSQAEPRPPPIGERAVELPPTPAPPPTPRTLTVKFQHALDRAPKVQVDGAPTSRTVPLSLGEHAVLIQPDGGASVPITVKVERSGNGLKVIAGGMSADCGPGASPVINVKSSSDLRIDGC